MQHRYLDTSPHQLAQGIDDDGSKSVIGVVEAVIARPGFEEVAENEQALGSTRTTGEEIKKNARNVRHLRRKMQVGNEQDQEATDLGAVTDR